MDNDIDLSKPDKVPEWARREASFAATHCSPAPIPDVLFDGNAVWQYLDERAKTRTSAENVSDVLDAVVRLMRGSVKENRDSATGSP